MKVVHVLASIASSWGGPPRVVRDLALALSRRGVENVVVTLHNRDSARVKLSTSVRLVDCGRAVIPKLAVPGSLKLARGLAREIKTADLVHIHEFWNVPHIAGALMTAISSRPYVLTPHGALQPGALRWHKYLKSIAWHSYEKRILANSSGVHVLTAVEARSVTALCPEVPLTLIPNGIDLDPIDKALEDAPSVTRFYRGVTPPYLLFVGRLAPEKGLFLLLEAFSILHRVMEDLQLVLVGPDEVGSWKRLQERARKLGVSGKITYLGIVSEPIKYRLFESAELFVLPSVSEGQSISLLEALACGTAAVISTGCNLPELEMVGAGKVVEPVPELFAETICNVLRDSANRESMEAKAREFVSARFSVDLMANEMLEFYRKAVNRGPKPLRSREISIPRVGV